MIHRLVRRFLLPAFKRAEKPAAWVLLIGGLVSFVSVLVWLFTVGDAKLATLLIAADLFVSGFSAVQESEDESDSLGQ